MDLLHNVPVFLKNSAILETADLFSFSPSYAGQELLLAHQ
jgi:hypothetical protein